MIIEIISTGLCGMGFLAVCGGIAEKEFDVIIMGVALLAIGALMLTFV